MSNEASWVSLHSTQYFLQNLHKMAQSVRTSAFHLLLSTNSLAYVELQHQAEEHYLDLDCLWQSLLRQRF